MATRPKILSKIKYIIGLCHKKRLMLFPWSSKGITSKMPWLMDSADGKAGEKGCISPCCGGNSHIPWWSLLFKQGNRILEMWLSCRQAVECFDSILLEWLHFIMIFISRLSGAIAQSPSRCLYPFVSLWRAPISPRRIADRPVSYSRTPATARKLRSSLADAI